MLTPNKPYSPISPKSVNNRHFDTHQTLKTPMKPDTLPEPPLNVQVFRALPSLRALRARPAEKQKSFLGYF